MDAIEEENQRHRRASFRASSKKHHDNLTPEQKDKKKKVKQAWYQRNRPRILERKALQRKVKLESKEHYERFIDVKNAMKDVCAYGCICCHSILTNTKDCKVAGGLKGLKKELGRSYMKSAFSQKTNFPRN